MSKHNFITYSSKRGAYGIVMPMEQYNYIVYTDGSIEFDDRIIKNAGLSLVTINKLADEFNILPDALINLINDNPSIQTYDDAYDFLKQKSESGELPELIPPPENLNIDDQVKENIEPQEIEGMGVVDLSDVDDESDRFKPGILNVLPHGAHTLEDRVGQVIFSSFRSLFAQDALALLGLMTNKNTNLEIMDSSIQNAVQEILTYLRRYPNTQFVLKVICNYRQLVEEITTKISQSIDFYLQRRKHQALAYNYTFKPEVIEKGIKSVKQGMSDSLMDTLEEQRASMAGALSGILFQPFLNIFASDYLSKYINVSAETPNLKQVISDMISDIDTNVLHPIRKNLAKIFKFSQTNVPKVCPSGIEDVHKIISNSVEMVKKELETAETKELISKLKNNPYFDFSGWKQHVTESLDRMSNAEDYNVLYSDIGNTFKKIVEMHVLRGYESLREYFFENKYYSTDKSNLDETAILGAFKNEIMNLRDKYENYIKSKLATSQPFLNSVAIVESMSRKPEEKESGEKFLNNAINGVRSIAETIDRKSTISNIEVYLTYVLGYQISPEGVITNRDLLENVRQMMDDALTFGEQVMTKSGNVIDINNTKFVVVGSKNDKLYLADLDELQSTQCTEVIECPQDIEYSIVSASAGMILRQCAIDKMVVRASRCSTCPYGLTYGKCSTCVYDAYTNKIVSAGKKQNTISVKVQKSELLDRLMGHIDLRPSTDPTEPISVWDRVVKKGSTERGTVTTINPDYSFLVAWDNGPTSVTWLTEVERCVE